MMSFLRVLRPAGVALGFAESDIDADMEEFYREDAEACPHCGQCDEETSTVSLVSFLLGIAISICFHAARI